MAKKKLWLILPVVLFAVLLAVIFRLNHTPEDSFVIPDHIVICLDAGHGGDDPGAVRTTILQWCWPSGMHWMRPVMTIWRSSLPARTTPP